MPCRLRSHSCTLDACGILEPLVAHMHEQAFGELARVAWAERALDALRRTCRGVRPWLTDRDRPEGALDALRVVCSALHAVLCDYNMKRDLARIALDMHALKSLALTCKAALHAADGRADRPATEERPLLAVFTCRHRRDDGSHRELSSQPFGWKGRHWRLVVYPHGREPMYRQHVAAYLQPVELSAARTMLLQAVRTHEAHCARDPTSHAAVGSKADMDAWERRTRDELSFRVHFHLVAFARATATIVSNCCHFGEDVRSVCAFSDNRRVDYGHRCLVERRVVQKDSAVRMAVLLERLA